MKLTKILLIVIVIPVILVVTGYLVLMTYFQGPIRIDITDSIQIQHSEREIVLPWYLRIISTYEGEVDGKDPDGNSFTLYYYYLPSIFEEAEINCIVSWASNTAIVFIGESRSMDVMRKEFSTVMWN